jgi:hypothetical protein
MANDGRYAVEPCFSALYFGIIMVPEGRWPLYRLAFLII